MADKHEAARLAVIAVVDPLVDGLSRNRLGLDFTAQIGQALADVSDGTPRLVDETFSPYERHWELTVLVAVAVYGEDADTARASLNVRLASLADAFELDAQLGGAVQTLLVDPPVETAETSTLGGPEIAGKVLPVRLHYATGRNPLEG